MAQPTSFRLSDEALQLIQLLKDDTGLERTAVVELAVRDLAKARSLRLPSKEEPKTESE